MLPYRTQTAPNIEVLRANKGEAREYRSQHQNEGAGETENPLTSGIVLQDSHMRHTSRRKPFTLHKSRRATSCGYNSSHPVWHALYECLQDIHGDSSPFLLQPFRELSNGFWPRLMSPHPVIQFVPKLFYRVEVGALDGPVQSANIVVDASVFILPQTNTSGPTPKAVEQPHTITPPPPNFLVGTIHSGRSRSPGRRHTHTHPSDRNNVNLDLSLHRTDFHCSCVQLRWSKHHLSQRALLLVVIWDLCAAALSKHPSRMAGSWPLSEDSSARNQMLANLLAFLRHEMLRPVTCPRYLPEDYLPGFSLTSRARFYLRLHNFAWRTLNKILRADEGEMKRQKSSAGMQKRGNGRSSRNPTDSGIVPLDSHLQTELRQRWMAWLGPQGYPKRERRQDQQNLEGDDVGRTLWKVTGPPELLSRQQSGSSTITSAGKGLCPWLTPSCLRSEQHLNEGAGEIGDTRENAPTSDIV
ncbi:hypothetical protein PR048_007159 [Dryococelus australis]|uniref:Telomerase reverse transcriptase n=1 Tax=Dryococelus australis TaxID=614101 RepID=A0ABQ9IE61_9NEOP|nr:hypothetical protein PR048_007159 [Dryococelus australis]